MPVTDTVDARPTPQVSVVVTHYRSLGELLGCLTALRRTTGVTHEVIVCDSAALDTTAEALRRYHPEAEYIGFPQNVGYAALVNAGLEASRGEHVLILNADVEVEPSTAADLLGVLAHHPELALVAPVLINADGSRQESAFAFHIPATVLHRRLPTGATPWGRKELTRFLEPSRRVRDGDGGLVDADWVLGAAMMVRRDAARTVGPMDSRYFLYFEDVDWCLRFWQAGYGVAVSLDARAHHAHARASRGGLRAVLANPLTRVHLRAAVRFFRKHGPQPERPARGPLSPAVVDLRSAAPSAPPPAVEGVDTPVAAR